MGFMTRYGFVPTCEVKEPYVLGIYWGIIQAYIPLQDYSGNTNV